MTAPEKPRGKMLELKERRGPVPPELLESVRQNNAVKTAIKRALAGGPRTVPEIAETAGLPARTILWTITAMRKYGSVVEDSTEGSYVRYALAVRDPR